MKRGLLALIALTSLLDATEAISLTARETVERESLLPFFPPIGYSPDGSRYVVMLASGDVDRNVVRVRILSGRTSSLDGAVAREVAVLSTTAYGVTPVTVNNRFHWTSDGARLMFLWDDSREKHQVVELNLDSGELKYRTHHPGGVLEFAANADGTALLYTAFAVREASVTSSSKQSGIVITDTSVMNLFSEALYGWREWRHVELFASSGNGAERRIPVPGNLGVSFLFGGLSISPDGRRAVINLPVPAKNSWEHYDSRLISNMIAEARADFEFPRLRQPFVLDIGSGVLRPLFDAPVIGGEAVWEPGGRRVVFGPTFLPNPQAQSDGAKGQAVIVFDLSRRTYAQLIFRSSMRSARYVPTRWQGGTIELTEKLSQGPPLKFTEHKGEWVESDIDMDLRETHAAVSLMIRQDLNTPPVLYGVRRIDGSERKLLELETGASRTARLGRVELFHWTIDNRDWTGRLYRPIESTALGPAPLAIQIKPMSPTEFSILGAESYPSTFVAQVLASRGIAVLQMELPDVGLGAEDLTPQEPRRVLSGILGAIENLTQQGIIDPKRVGLSGFSRSGWYVEYALTQSDFPFAAAVAADNIDVSYGQITLFGGHREFINDVGAEPFGTGLSAWLEHSPGFNADRVRTPLRLQVHGGGPPAALAHWEMFSRLKSLGKPVELYLVPDSDRGMHILQNPVQLLASREGIADWFDFWLCGREDPAPAKVEQYTRWRVLRQQHETDLKKTRRPWLTWTAAPRVE